MDNILLDNRIEQVYLLNSGQSYDNLTKWIQKLQIVPLRIISDTQSKESMYVRALQEYVAHNPTQSIVLIEDQLDINTDIDDAIRTHLDSKTVCLKTEGLCIMEISDVRTYLEILNNCNNWTESVDTFLEKDRKRKIISILPDNPFQTVILNDCEFKIQLVTVASDPTDGYERFMESCRIMGCPVVTLGMGEPWVWDLTNSPGGGKKINLFKKYLDQFDTDDRSVMVFTDSYDVVMVDSLQSILMKFLSFNADVVFSAETDIWPDPTIAKQFPRPLNNPYVYLNSGGYVGSVKNLKKIMSVELTDGDDDQLYFQHRYLESVRSESELKIVLDHTCTIFQTMSSRFEEIKVDVEQNLVHNILFPLSRPSVLHGNGGVKSKMHLNSLANYVPKRFDMKTGFMDIRSDKSILNQNNYILFLIQVHEETVQNYVNVLSQSYPHNYFRFRFYGLYPRNKLGLPAEIPYTYCRTDVDIRNFVIRAVESIPSDYYFMGTTNHFLTDPNVLIKLLMANYGIVAPMLVSKQTNTFSNFWGDVAANGYYARSEDYHRIVKREQRGVWNVPYISGSMLIRHNRMTDVLKELKSQELTNEDFDMYFCRVLRRKYIFLHVMNFDDYGYVH